MDTKTNNPNNPNKASKPEEEIKISVEQFYHNHAAMLQLRIVCGEDHLGRLITKPSISRPGLALTGFYKHFIAGLIYIMGAPEMSYLKSLTENVRRKRLEDLFRKKIPCLIFTDDLKPTPLMLELAEQCGIPFFLTALPSTKIVTISSMCLEEEFAPCTTQYGSMVDIQGVGVLIRGESGIGKSECVLSLINRGYSLVSDDITKFRYVEGGELVGFSPDISRHFMEVRGIGIINVVRIFGASSIRDRKRLDLVVTLKFWDSVENVDRLGLDAEYYEVLNKKIPHVTIPIRPGRDIGGLIEVAAMDQKLKSIGEYAAEDFNNKLLMKMQGF
jgi:HPr kinase/phosphorylase